MSHEQHGRGNAEEGPEDSDCPCRITAEWRKCAIAGCGFCRAHFHFMVRKAAEYHATHGPEAVIEGCPCCFP